MHCPAIFRNNVLFISVGRFAAQIAVNEIQSMWDALTHYPDRRARLELEELAERINSFATYAQELAAGGGELAPAEEAGRFIRRHVEVTRAYWHAESRCLSCFIVGPANFPTARNEKRQKSRDLRAAEVREHVAAARKAAERRAFPYGAPGGAIRSSNPDAVALLREKIAELEQRQDVMKAANAALRRALRADSQASGQSLAHAVAEATGWSPRTARAAVKADYMGRRGFAAWALTNNLAQIKRLRQRLRDIETGRERGTVGSFHETPAGTVEIVEDAEAARLRLIFSDKPDDATRRALKASGFRWSPSRGAWQRHLNDAGGG